MSKDDEIDLSPDRFKALKPPFGIDPEVWKNLIISQSLIGQHSKKISKELALATMPFNKKTLEDLTKTVKNIKIDIPLLKNPTVENTNKIVQTQNIMIESLSRIVENLDKSHKNDRRNLIIGIISSGVISFLIGIFLVQFS